MIKQVFTIKDKWKVIVYYNIDYDFFNEIEDGLKAASTPIEEIYDIKRHLLTDAYAFTYSNLNKRISIVGFNSDDDKANYMSSITHEAEHIKQAILEYYNIEDKGETPAYLIGYIISKMYSVFVNDICKCKI